MLENISPDSRWKNFKKLYMAIPESTMCTGATILGVVGSIATVFTLGTVEKISKLFIFSECSSFLLQFSFLRAASVLNPKNISELNKKLSSKGKEFEYGTLSSKIAFPIVKKALKLSEYNLYKGFLYKGFGPYKTQTTQTKDKTSKDNKTFFKKHVVSRFLFGLSALVSIITRIFDFILGFLGSLLVLFTCAKYEKINEFALKNLSSLGVIFDVCRGICCAFRP